MPYLLVRHKVDDYAAWKPGFDDHSSARSSYGSRGGHVFRNADDPNEVIVLLEVEDLDRAREFTASADLRETMQQLGVNKSPDVYFLNEDDRTDA